MKHPDREAWVSFLYDDEMAAVERAELTAHLAECAACRAQLKSWQGVRRCLDRVRLPAVAPSRRLFYRGWSWAAAAALFLGLGALLGRAFLAPAPDLTRLRDELREELAQLVRADLAQTSSNLIALSLTESQNWLAAYAAAQERQRLEDLRAIQTALSRTEQQRMDDYARLRGGMETVALFTDAGFRQTRQQLVQLASLPPSDGGSRSIP